MSYALAGRLALGAGAVALALLGVVLRRKGIPKMDSIRPAFGRWRQGTQSTFEWVGGNRPKAEVDARELIAPNRTSGPQQKGFIGEMLRLTQPVDRGFEGLRAFAPVQPTHWLDA